MATGTQREVAGVRPHVGLLLTQCTIDHSTTVIMITDSTDCGADYNLKVSLSSVLMILRAAAFGPSSSSGNEQLSVLMFSIAASHRHSEQRQGTRRRRQLGVTVRREGVVGLVAAAI